MNPSDKSKAKRKYSSNSSNYFKIIWTLLVLFLLLCLVGIATIRFYLIPNIDNHKEWIAQRLSASMEQTVRLGTIEARWDGLHPDLTFYDLDVFDKQDNPFFSLDRLDVKVSIKALLLGDINLLKIKLFSPILSVKRDKNSAIWVSGKQIFPSTRKDDGPLLEWLIRQKQVEVSGGTLIFMDELSNNHLMSFTNVLLIAKLTGDGVGIVLTSEAQNSWYEEITLSVENSNILELADSIAFKGDVAWEVSALQMTPFENWLPPSILMRKSVLSSRGIANIDDSKIQTLAMDLRLNDFSLKQEGDVNPLGVSQSSFQVSMDSSEDKQAITFSNVFALFDGGLSAHLDVIRIDRDLSSGKNQFVTRDLSLDVVKLVGRGVFEDSKYLTLLERVLPGGMLNLIDLSWYADNEPFSMRDISVQARFENAGLYSLGKSPGVQGLSGAVKYQDASFLVDIDSSDITLEAPTLFAQPLYFSRFKSMFIGKKISRHWEVDMTDVTFSTADLKGTAAARATVAQDFNGSTLDLQVKVNKVDLSRLPFYLPNKLKKTKMWFEKRVHSGTAENIIFNVRGEMSPAFFSREGADFEVTADVKSGTIEIGGGWPKIHDISGRFGYLDHRVFFSPSEAKIFGVDVSDSELKIEKTGTPEATLVLNGMATATVSDLVRYVVESPLNKVTKGTLSNMVGNGYGELELSLEIPLLNRKNTLVDGVISLIGSRLRINDKAPELEDFEALVEFNKSAVTIRNGQARIFDGQATFASKNVDRGLGRIEFTADTSSKAFMDYLNIPIDLSGQIGSSGVLEFKSSELQIDLNVELKRLISELPSPLDRLSLIHI